ncbi:hypothetical protein WN48_06701 [Eufriesea mexicana]|uniref:Uncharacterized protein n=1 Tax=Eufriesea mexicana TaxID=516756 RepID=A0A310SJC1_9HYME|nr:hypothetical protein WN48_06701 [Eufriesea mexicana]
MGFWVKDNKVEPKKRLGSYKRKQEWYTEKRNKRAKEGFQIILVPKGFARHFENHWFTPYILFNHSTNIDHGKPRLSIRYQWYRGEKTWELIALSNVNDSLVSTVIENNAFRNPTAREVENSQAPSIAARQRGNCHVELATTTREIVDRSDYATRYRSLRCRRCRRQSIHLDFLGHQSTHVRHGRFTVVKTGTGSASEIMATERYLVLIVQPRLHKPSSMNSARITKEALSSGYIIAFVNDRDEYPVHVIDGENKL